MAAEQEPKGIEFCTGRSPSEWEKWEWDLLNASGLSEEGVRAFKVLWRVDLKLRSNVSGRQCSFECPDNGKKTWRVGKVTTEPHSIYGLSPDAGLHASTFRKEIDDYWLGSKVFRFNTSFALLQMRPQNFIQFQDMRGQDLKASSYQVLDIIDPWI